MECPNCNKEMINLGNIEGLDFTTTPSQWDQVWVCDDCKVKKTILMTGPNQPDYSYLNEYTEV